MIEYKINEEQVTIPTGWHDFTVGHAQKIFAASNENPKLWQTDFIFRFSLYTGMNYEALKALNFSGTQLLELLSICDFEREPITDYIAPMKNALQFYNTDKSEGWLIRVPRSNANFDVRSVDVPADLSQRAVGSKIVFEQKVLPEYAQSGTLINVLHLALAIYFQPIYFNRKFDTDQVLQLAEQCKLCRFTDALPVADFFLKKSQSLSKRNPY